MNLLSNIIKKIGLLFIISTFFMPTSAYTLNENIAQDNEENKIPIAMATDNNYVLPTIVAMTSMLENLNATTKYEYYLLLSGNVDLQNKQKLLSLENKYKNCKINLIDMKDAFSAAYTSSHITTAAYYRLLLAELLPNINKIIYLDVDMIIKKDLLELFNTDIENYYLAGVKNPHGYIGRNPKFDWANYLEIKSIDQYINSGMLIMNLKKMREDNLQDKFLNFINNKKALNQKIFLHDQDVINSVCYNNIYHLPCKYNLMLHYCAKNIEEFENNKWLKECYDRDEWIEAHENPIILHYSSGEKPWKNASAEMYRSQEWWEIAEKTDYLNEIKELSLVK